MQDGVWLRTYSGPGSDAVFSSMMDSRSDDPGGNQLVLDNADLYNYGTNWQHIFTRLPQLLDRLDMSAEEYQERVEEATKEALQQEIDDWEMAEANDYDPDEDATPWPRLYECYQWAVTFGFLFTIDEKALSPSSQHSGKVRVLWFDECGRVVRYNRQNAWDASNTIVGYKCCFVREHGVWMNARVGKDYDWGALLGPPYDKDWDDSDGNEDSISELTEVRL